jgi:hypothetical protein
MNDPMAVTRSNGALWAAILASGVGALAVGLMVILNESGIYSAPTLYGPAGGVSGRTTIAAVIWLVSWAVLHRLWGDRGIGGGRVTAISAGLILLGLVGTFPPVWSLF